MAQAKTGASAKRSRGSQKTQTRTRGASNRARNSSSKSRSTSNRSSASRSKPSTNGKGRADAALHAVEGKAKDAGHAVGSAASKAKVPLVAGGAALAGAAGGLAVGMRQRRHKGLGMAMPRPQVKVKSRDIAHAAKEVGKFGAQVGQLASELQQAREANSGKHRSPVEVVLEGLTARRSRS